MSLKDYHRGFSYARNGNLTEKRIYNTATGSVKDRWNYSYFNHSAVGIDTTLHGADRFEMGYDAVGNMVYQRDNDKDRRKEMAYDSSNRIRKVIDPDKEEVVGEYFYDDQGFRVRKIKSPRPPLVKGGEEEEKTVEVLYPSMYFGYERQLDRDGIEINNTTFSVNNVYLNGVRIAAVLPDGQSRYYLTDQVDSVKVVVDDSGLPITRFEYLPYGETWFTEEKTGLEEEHNPKFNSQELDKETGYYFYNARHYDPEIGRFVTADNVVDGQFDTQGWNRFSYVKGNPVRYKDPTGHKSDENVHLDTIKKDKYSIEFDSSVYIGNVSYNKDKKEIVAGKGSYLRLDVTTKKNNKVVDKATLDIFIKGNNNKDNSKFKKIDLKEIAKIAIESHKSGFEKETASERVTRKILTKQEDRVKGNNRVKTSDKWYSKSFVKKVSNSELNSNFTELSDVYKIRENKKYQENYKRRVSNAKKELKNLCSDSNTNCLDIKLELNKVDK